MPTILHIESSARLDGSVSRTLAGEVLERIRQRTPALRVVERDLGREPLPHLDDAFVAAMFTPADARSAEQQRTLARSETLIAELEAADAVVIGAPMYNFGPPSALKAWIDHIVRARRTFAYGEGGTLVGLVPDRPVVVAVASGGVYGEGPGRANDFLVPYLASVLGKIGLKDLRVLRAEGLALGPDAAAAGLARARAAIDEIVPAFPVARAA